MKWSFQRLKQIDKEREKLIRTLRDALTKIKRLHGMLPSCASCKKIRNDEGYWDELEAYIEEHSEKRNLLTVFVLTA